MIDPLFKSQSFITDSRKEVQLTEDLIAFQFNYNNSLTIEQYQAIQNKTYLIYQPYFYYQDANNNIYQRVNLDVIQCTSPYLQNYNCIDFSQVSNYTFVYDHQNSIISQIYINIYGCLDLDGIKTTTPDNCASQSEIDAVINGESAGLILWLKTQQFNTTSMELQTNYRFLETFSYSNQFLMSTLKAQMQETNVKQGLIIQGQQIYSSPIQYGQTIYTYDRQFSLSTGLGPYHQVNLQLDEIVQFIQIQYPTITQILALVNSVGFVVVIFRIIAQNVSQNLIRKEFFVLILRNLFQEKCQQILKNKNLIKQCDIQMVNQEREEEFSDNVQEQQRITSVIIPDFQYKFLSKQINSNINLNLSDSFQKQKLQIEDESEQKSQIKIDNCQASCDAKKSQLGKSKHFINLPKSDKIDTNLQNESHLSQLTDTKILNTQKKEIQSQRQQMLQSKQSQFQKSSFKDEQKNQVITNKKAINEAISQKLQVMKSQRMRQAIQNTIFKFKCFKVKDFLQSKGIKDKQMKKMNKEVQNYLNINEIYKDLILLKKAVSMVLSLDQLAAIQLIGLTDNFMNIDLDKKDSKLVYEQERKKLNHFEKQYSILQCEQLQIDYIEKFLTKCQDQEDLTEIDKRILYSITKF